MFNIKLSRLVEDGDAVIFDSGTTAYYLASELVKKRGGGGFLIL